jgi:hypothetical protein
MPNEPVRANVTALSDEAAGFAILTRALDLASVNVGHARLVAGALDEKLVKTPDGDRTAAIAIALSGADAQLARARKLVADLQARRADVRS